jgi:hypothetical protein
MERIPGNIKKKVTTLAIYTGESGSKKVDIFFQYLPWPRLFEWNILYHTALPFYCFGLDGILCEEVNREDVDNETYRQNLINARPLIIPNTKIHSIVTNRAEKYRVESESWLSKYNCSSFQFMEWML